MSGEVYESMVQQRGREYRNDQIKPYSHYRDPIDRSHGRLAGNSRVWGDASPDVQSRVVDELIQASRRAGLSVRETAYVLAIARQESGFNPDAAAGTTSASGVGQFVDATGAGLTRFPLDSRNRFDARAGSDALVEHFVANRDLARKRGQGEEYIYKYHHDGPTRDYGGLALANAHIIPRLDVYERFVRDRLPDRQAAMQDRSAPHHGAALQSRDGRTAPSPHDSPNAMHATLLPSVPPAPERAHSSALVDHLLRLHDRGPEVVALQEALNCLGYTGRHGRPLETRSGVFGAHTHHAVAQFQRRHGLADVDGIVGDDTRAALQVAAARPLLSEATHPAHRLYAGIARQLPAGTRPEVAANVALQAMENGITSAQRLARVDVRGDDVFVVGTTPGERAKVDLRAPTPTLQQMSDHVREQVQEATRTRTQTDVPVREAPARAAIA